MNPALIRVLDAEYETIIEWSAKAGGVLHAALAGRDKHK